MKKTLAIGSVNMILWAANTRGLDTSDILKSLQISPQSLQNPDERIEIAKVQTIWKAIVEKLGDRSLPLQMGEIISPISVGILAYVMMHAPNLGKSIEKLCQYQDIVCNAVETTFHQKEKLSVIDLRVNSEDMIYPEFALESEMSVYASAFRALTLSEFKLTEVHFEHGPTSDLAIYQRVFQCPLLFESGKNWMVFESSQLEKPILNANASLFPVFEQHAQDLLAPLQPKTRFSDVVKTEIVKCLVGQEPSLSHIAMTLGVGIRNIQKKLKEEGKSFQQLLDEARKELAIKHLKQPYSSTTDIAYLLGYSEPSVFYRSFKKWTGQTPSAFRA